MGLTYVRLLPIASIITPATLSVVLKDDISSTSLQNIPRVDFSRLSFLGIMLGTWVGDSFHTAKEWSFPYSGPGELLQRTARSVAVRKDILPIDTSFPTINTTWISEFHGPSLSCGRLEDDQTERIRQNIEKHYLIRCQNPPTYLAWYPRVWSEQSDRLQHEPYFWPCSHRANANRTECKENTPESVNWFRSQMEHDGTTPEAMFYVALLPNVVREPRKIAEACVSKQIGLSEEMPAIGKDMALIRCQMHNSTYEAKFNYTSSAHNVRYDIVDRGPKSQLSFKAISLTYSPIKDMSEDCANPYAPNCEGKRFQIDYNRSLIPQYVHQSVLEAFTNLITGNITFDDTTYWPARIPLQATSYIRMTSLFDTKELYYATSAGLSDSDTTFNQTTFVSLEKAISGSTSNGSNSWSMSLPDAIESVFNNLTVSLMGEPQFRSVFLCIIILC